MLPPLYWFNWNCSTNVCIGLFYCNANEVASLGAPAFITLQTAELAPTENHLVFSAAVALASAELLKLLFGYHCNQLPLIERFPQWLSGPSSPLSVTAGPPVSNQTRFKWCSDAQHFLFNYRHRWHKMHKAVEAWKQKRSV